MLSLPSSGLISYFKLIIKFQVGQRTKKDLIVAYIKDVAGPELVEGVKKRIKKIDIDNVMESGY